MYGLFVFICCGGWFVFVASFVSCCMTVCLFDCLVWRLWHFDLFGVDIVVLICCGADCLVIVRLLVAYLSLFCGFMEFAFVVLGVCC